MCGISGLVALGAEPVDRIHLERFNGILAHRGPQDSGIYCTPQAGLAHRRLAIIDLSPAGHGPMSNEDGTVWITYNGEIYNYRDLLPELEARGHRFRSVCDTEVVLHAYEEWGDQCVERFNGMFAFALWDVRRARLLCARDRAGVKPFYYMVGNGFFAFASEIKALLALPWAQRRVSAAVAFDFLVPGYVDHTDRTFFRDIVALPPAHTLAVEAGTVASRRYWSLPMPDPDTLTMQPSLAQQRRYTEDFLALLLDSVRLRLRSDVAVGSCLSGGLDSSTIVCLANSLLFPGTGLGDGAAADEAWHRRGEQQRTFSACFAEPGLDERPFIEAVVAQTGVAPFSTFPSGETLFADLPAIVYHQDEPFLSSSIVAQWHVMRLAREHGVTVLLDGQGADELLCGYAGYIGPFLADLLRAGRLAAFARESHLFQRYYGRRFGSSARLLARTLRAQHSWLRPQVRSRFDPARAVPPWLAPELAFDESGTPRAWPRSYTSEQPGYLPSVTHWLFAHGSLPSLLRYEDRNSMAFSLEARVPFLDYRLVEYVFGAPNAVRLGGGLTKQVLRRAARGVIPEVVRARRDKLGFTTPEATWLRGPARAAIAELLASPSPSLREYIRPDAARETFTAFAQGAPVSEALIWRWISLDLWLRTFVDRGAAALDAPLQLAPVGLR
ncbi:MAG TPA: asparagine synthase (glutamine-hydrolyzing) [Chloroflexota bacterium]|nr:asparagine synthase (glutamine-hydrolyzing) [Chloroflexota bacterium]